MFLKFFLNFVINHVLSVNNGSNKMTKSINAQVHAFERTVFLNSRHFKKNAGAATAALAIAASLNELKQHESIAGDSLASDLIAQINLPVTAMVDAANSGANSIATQAYSELVAMIPQLHFIAAKLFPDLARGDDPTIDPALLDAAIRVQTILGG